MHEFKEAQKYKGNVIVSASSEGYRYRSVEDIIVARCNRPVHGNCTATRTKAYSPIYQTRIATGGMAVGIGFHRARAGVVWPYTQSSSRSSCASSSWPTSQSSTNTLMPTPSSSGAIRTSGPGRRCRLSSWTFSFFSAAMRSSARGVGFGGSSSIGSQPTGGEPGGEMRKFFSCFGGRR